MIEDGLRFYRTPGTMTALPDRLGVGETPSDLDEMRGVVQGILVHRDWALAYGLTNDTTRRDEANLRSTAEVLTRLFEISGDAMTIARPPVDRVHGICRHFVLLQTALLRSHGVPARARCGFSSYFDPTNWVDHWITERWDGDRWVRDDPQIDDLQAKLVNLDFDPYDQPPRKFLTGAEAWIAARAGDIDPDRFGIFDMWGLPYISGNLITDFACLNKVELLPWDSWGMMTGPYHPLTDDALAVLDDVAALVAADDFAAIRARYLEDERLRVPADIVTFLNDEVVEVHIDV